MTLTITKADEVIEVNTVCLTLYSQPGLGKTSLAFTASNPLLFDFDGGAHRAVDRKDTVQIEKWADVAHVNTSDLDGYDTIILDTVGKALEFLSADILAQNSRLGYAGALNQQGWGQLNVRFRAFLSNLRRHGKDIVLIAHMDEKHDGDEIKERLKIQGGSKDVVLTDSDMIARISIHNKQRHLVFSPTETSFGKDPGGFGSLVIPQAGDGAFEAFLSTCIAQAKESMSALSAAQVERRSEIEWFKAALPGIKDPEGINDLLGRAKKAGRDVQMMVVARATEMQLEFDQATGGYVYIEELAQKMDQEKAAEEAA